MKKYTVFYKKMKKGIQVKNGVLYFLFLLMMILVMVNKKNLHVDEILTYGLSNYSSGSMMPIEGEAYSPAENVLIEYTAVNENSKFDYKNVWQNQLRDTHPPLYYMLVHTICSLFPNKFSIWYAGIINVLFALLTLYAVRCLVYELTENRDAVTLTSMIFIFSAGILSSITFLRMYIMAMFEVTYITLLFVRAVRKGYTQKFYINVIIISVLGALTHYYFIVYLFFLFLFFGIYLLANRQMKDTGFLIVSMAISGGLSVAVFPGMIKHMFLKDGYRGQESIENLKKASLTEYGHRLKGFYSFINEQLFGGIFTYILTVCLIGLIWYLVNKKTRGGVGLVKEILLVCRNIKVYWILAIIPSVCYFFLVSKMAVYITSRYLTPIYAVVLTVIGALTYRVGCKILKGKKNNIFFVVLSAIIIVNSWKVCSWEYLYSSSTALLEKADEYSEENNLYIYDVNWKIYPSFYELSKYKSVTFFNQKNISAIGDFPYKNDMELIVSIINGCDVESILNQILAVCPFIDSYEEIGSYGYATSWHLFSQSLDIHQYRIYDYHHEEMIGSKDASIGGNIYTTVHNSVVKGVFNKDMGYGTLWVDTCVFDIQNGVITEGSNIRLWGYNGSNTQLWKIQDNADGSYTFLAKNEQLAITKDFDGNIYLDKLKVDDESQKWWLEIVEYE